MIKNYFTNKEVYLHLLFWIIYVLSEYLANFIHLQPGKSLIFLRSILLSLPLLLAPTYFIALFAVPRYLKKGKIYFFLFWVVLAAVFVFFARIKWLELINYLEMNIYYKMPASKVIKNVIRDYSIIALAICIYIIGDWRKKQQLNEQLVKTKAEAEIKLLKGQLHPHFLFNSLNNIYSLALLKSDLTADSILKLTELLDYLVYWAGKEKVALTKEIQLLNNYVELEKLRYDEKLKVNLQIDAANEALRVTPLMLLPFAENCFKHGGIGKNGYFEIDIKLKANRKKLLFSIKNTKKINDRKKRLQGGLGLQNIQKRLQLVYPKRHRLHIQDQADYYEILLEIDFKEQKKQRPLPKLL